ncbi:hypothetical protein F5Y09DRAFT_342588 [Xylaria sp. FL1042]|nr:hypothetical protein F5Y09DRAFT_342588 [Xylaria sp. FL1042]
MIVTTGVAHVLATKLHVGPTGERASHERVSNAPDGLSIILFIYWFPPHCTRPRCMETWCGDTQAESQKERLRCHEKSVRGNGRRPKEKLPIADESLVLADDPWAISSIPPSGRLGMKQEPGNRVVQPLMVLVIRLAPGPPTLNAGVPVGVPIGDWRAGTVLAPSVGATYPGSTLPLLTATIPPRGVKTWERHGQGAHGRCQATDCQVTATRTQPQARDERQWPA